MGNLTSTLSIQLQDGVSGPAAKAAGALRGLAGSGKDLSKLGKAHPEIDRLVKDLERLRAAGAKMDTFKLAKRGLEDMGVDLKRARQNLAQEERLIAKRQRTLEHFARKRVEEPERWQKWKDSGLIAGVESKLAAHKKARDKAEKALKPIQEGFVEQGRHVRTMRNELLAAGVELGGWSRRADGAAGRSLNLGKAARENAAAIGAVDAALQREVALLSQVSSGAGTATGKIKALADANRDLARGMGELGGKQLRAIEDGRRLADGMSRQTRVAAAAAASEAAAARAARAEARRDALTVAGTGAGLYAGHQAAHIGKEAVLSAAEFDLGTRAQRVYTDVSERDQDEVLLPQAKRIGQETKFSNLDVVKAQTAAMQGLPSSFAPRLKAEVAEGIIENVKNYALLMETDLKSASETLRSYLQTTGKDISTKEKALAESNKAVNQMVAMAKAGGMNSDDVQQYINYAAAPDAAAGIKPETMMTMGALARIGGLRGDVAGVAMRSMASKMVAPTTEGIAALNAAGIKHSDFVKMPDKLSTEALESQFQLKLGKGFTPAIRKKIEEINNNKELIGQRDKYTAAVTDAVSPMLGKTKKGTVRASDSNKAAKAAGQFHKLSATEVDTEGLLRAAFEKKMTLAQLNAWLTDKHGGKGAITQKQWDEFKPIFEKIVKAGQQKDFAEKKAKELMDGLGGSFENLKGSIENFYLSVGLANKGLLKFAFDTAGSAIDVFSKLPQGVQQFLSIAAGLGAAAFAIRSAFTVGKALLGLGGAAALGGSATALTGSAAALDGAAAALTRAVLGQGVKGAAAGAAGNAAAGAAGGAAAGAGGGAAAGAAGGAAVGSLVGPVLVAGGVVAGGAAASVVATDAVKNRDFADPYLDGGLLGADPAGYGLGAAIVHAPDLPQARAQAAIEARARENARKVAGASGIRGSVRPTEVGSGRLGFGLGGAQNAGAAVPTGEGASDLAVPGFGRSPLDPTAVQAATAALARFKGELAGVESQLAGLQASGEAAFSPDAFGLEARKAELEGLIDGLKAKLQTLGQDTAGPKPDTSGLDTLGQKTDAAQAKLQALASTNATPTVGTGPLDALIAKIDSALSKLAQLGAAAASANAQVAAVGSGGGGSGSAVRQRLAGNYANETG